MDSTTLDVHHRHTTQRLIEHDIRREAQRSRVADIEEKLKTETNTEKYKALLDELVDAKDASQVPAEDHSSYLAKVGSSLFKYYDRRSSCCEPGAPLPSNQAAGKKPRERRPRNRQPKTTGPGISSFFEVTDAAEDDTALGGIVTSYMQVMGKRDFDTLLEDDAFCAACLTANSCEMDVSDGAVTCTACGDTTFVGVDNERPSYKEPLREVSYYSYKRLNHFNEWLSQIQGKETTFVPDEVLETITSQLRRERIVDMSLVNTQTIKRILKKHKLSRYFEHASFICNRLCGVKSPQFSPELEEKLRHMFQEIQAPFLRHSPPNRSNFLSYSYVLNKMLYLLGEDDLLPHFTLLKSRFKLLSQETVWKAICADLGWQFYPSI